VDRRLRRVFAPSLFMGQCWKRLRRRRTPHVPELAISAGAYGRRDGAVFAATSRAPITAVLIIFELTGDYRIILPLMFAIVLATALSGAVTPTPSTR